MDGTLIRSQSRFGNNSYYTDPEPLPDNFAVVKELYDRGAQIIFTTSREAKYHDATQTMLRKLGFDNCLLLTGLNISARILINDYNESNPYPRAIAYNIKRDTDTLREIMK